MSLVDPSFSTNTTHDLIHPTARVHTGRTNKQFPISLTQGRISGSGQVPGSGLSAAEAQGADGDRLPARREAVAQGHLRPCVGGVPVVRGHIQGHWLPIQGRTTDRSLGKVPHTRHAHGTSAHTPRTQHTRHALTATQVISL